MEEERIAQAKAQHKAEEAARLQAIQAGFIAAQRALLQPQTVEIDDPDVIAFQAKIPVACLRKPIFKTATGLTSAN